MDVAEIEQARSRFAAAVEKLEAAAGRVAGERDSMAKDLATASAERDRLAGELAVLKESHRTLQELTETVSGRLDGTIGRVRSALGE